MVNKEPNRCRRVRPIVRSTMATVMLLSMIIYPALAQSKGSSGTSSDEWQFTVAPYLILPWMDGKTAVRGHEVEVDVGPSQIFDNIQFGAMGYFEARKGAWAVGVDAIYMALGTDVDQPDANVDFNQGAYTFAGMRQLNGKVDLLFGARWNVLQGDLGFKGPLQVHFKETKQFVDPLVGLKLRQPLGGRWHFTMQADIGGFGAGSDFAWHVFPVIGREVGKRSTFVFGYRVLSMDYQTGSMDQLFKYDIVTQGPVFGMAFRF